MVSSKSSGMRRRYVAFPCVAVAMLVLWPRGGYAQQYQRNRPVAQIPVQQTDRTMPVRPSTTSPAPAVRARELLEAAGKSDRIVKGSPEADLLAADQRFARSALADAERLYDRVLRSNRPRLHGYAHYGKGWVSLERGDPQNARAAFIAAIRAIQDTPGGERLRRAAMRALARAHAAIGAPGSAHAAFKAVDEDLALDLMSMLGDVHLSDGNARDAVRTFRELRRLAPDHALACRWQHGITRGVLTVGARDQQVQEIEALVSLHVDWRASERRPAAQRNECGDIAESVNREVATAWHNEAVKTRSRVLASHAQALYRVYLASFPTSARASMMQYYAAELAWFIAEREPDPRHAITRWEQAAAAFTRVAKAGKVTPAVTREAAHAAVLSWKNALALAPPARAPAPAASQRDPAPRPIPTRERALLDALDLYIQIAGDPADDSAVMMRFLKGKVLWRHDHLHAAVRIFETIVTDHLDHEIGEHAVDLLLDTLNRMQRHDAMVRWIDALLENRAFLADKRDLARRLEQIKQQSLRRDAEQLERAAAASGDVRKYDECARAYMAIYNRAPRARRGDELLYNAGVCFEQGKSMGPALASYEQLRSRYPSSRLAERALLRMSNIYARLAWYDRAATSLEDYARRYGGDKHAVTALSDAIRYRTSLGHDEQAIADVQLFIKLYGRRKSSLAADAMWRATAIYHRRGDRDGLIRHLQRYLRVYGRTGGIDRQIVAHAQIGMSAWAASCPGAIDGACVTSRVIQVAPCGQQVVLTPARRDPRRASAAQASFAQAIAMFGNGDAIRHVPGHGADRAARIAVLHEHVNAARFHQAEAELARFFELRPPALRPPGATGWRARDLARLDAWLTEVERRMSAARIRYDAAMQAMTGSQTGHYRIAGRARQGQLHRAMSYWLSYAAGTAHDRAPHEYRARALHLHSVPPVCERGSAATAGAAPGTATTAPASRRSAALQHESSAQRRAAIEQFRACAILARDSAERTRWSVMCEAALDDLLPVHEFSVMRERHGTPTADSPIISLEGSSPNM